MTHQDKLAHFDALLEERGLWKSNAKPPAFWLLWKLGFEVPPPYFLAFTQAWIGAGVSFGLPFGVAAGLIRYFLVGGWKAFSLWSFMAFAGVAGGTAFGLCMAYIWGWQREKLDLPPWSEFPRPEVTPPNHI